MEDWYQSALKYCKSSKKLYFALVANKCDLEHLRAVKQEKHSKFASEKKMQSFSVSARTGESVKKIEKNFLKSIH